MDTTRATGVAQVLVSAANPCKDQSQHATATKTLTAPSAVLLQDLPLQRNVSVWPFPSSVRVTRGVHGGPRRLCQDRPTFPDMQPASRIGRISYVVTRQLPRPLEFLCG